jgi:hypothetical protein
MLCCTWQSLASAAVRWHSASAPPHAQRFPLRPLSPATLEQDLKSRSKALESSVQKDLRETRAIVLKPTQELQAALKTKAQEIERLTAKFEQVSSHQLMSASSRPAISISEELCPDGECCLVTFSSPLGMHASRTWAGLGESLEPCTTPLKASRRRLPRSPQREKRASRGGSKPAR